MIYLGVVFIYAVLAMLMAYGFEKAPNLITNENANDLKISVVVIARNEEEYIQACLKGIIQQNYPKECYEIIVVDDHSSDKTFTIATNVLSLSGIDFKIIQNTEHKGKKQSLIKAIDAAKYGFIITRDADTFTPSANWLSTFSSFYHQTKQEFVIAPIAIEHQKSILSSLQEIESAIVSVFTLATDELKIPFLCSGANLMFSKRLFELCNKYQSHIHIRSGDDVFFLNEVKKAEPHQIAYLKNKEAIVYTYPEKTFFDLIKQKIRWSGKVFQLNDTFNWISSLVIAFANFVFVFAVLDAFLGVFNAKLALFFVFLKLIIDILLVFLASRFVKVKSNVLFIGMVAILYPLYASTVAFLATLIKPKWKLK
jgi:cellulose synthase/poly-beta-1,6-N-acetylglucosamine synthase-like glycosyltransferase